MTARWLLVPLLILHASCTDPNTVGDGPRDAAPSDRIPDATTTNADVRLADGPLADGSSLDGPGASVMADASGIDQSGQLDGPTITTDGPGAAACLSPDQLSCGGTCVDASRDRNHCGACGYTCAPFQVCSAKKCSPRYEATVSTGTVPGTLWDVAISDDGSIFAAGI